MSSNPCRAGAGMTRCFVTTPYREPEGGVRTYVKRIPFSFILLNRPNRLDTKEGRAGL